MLKFLRKKKSDPAAAESRPNAESEPGSPPSSEAQDKNPVDLVEAPEPLVVEPENVVSKQDDVTESSPESEPAPEAGPRRRSWRERLAASGMARGLGSVFARNPRLDENLLDDLETTLITADVGVDTSTALVENLRRRMQKREFADSAALVEALRADLVALLDPVAQPLSVGGARPFVLLVVGVNGVGKTTTIGKLARRYRDAGHGVVLAAGDTFRAAAVEQLRAWGERNQVPVIAQGQGADSASVIFDSLQTAMARGSDILIADTAGRLHTQGGLMDELGKIVRVLKKLDPEAPHEVLMVVDGTTGANAISQVRQFREAANVTGLVVTKLDGSAKGGVVFALAREFGLPLRYVGLGEQAEDLREFDPAAFVDGLLPAASTSANG